MTSKVHVTEQPVVLEGYQAVLKPGKFGYTLTAILTQDIVDKLEDEREETLKWAESKLKNPKRSVLKPQPWEEVSNGKYKVKFSWNESMRPPIVDTEGTVITDPNTPIFGGSQVKLGFRQKPYILKDGVTYGTSLKLCGIQIITLNAPAGIDRGDLSEEDVVALFGKTKGYKVDEPNITANTESTEYEMPVFDPDEDF